MLEATFDSTNALSSMYLWIVFGFLATMLNCDLQRMLKNNLLVVHLSGLVAFFFLFTLLDSNNKSSVGVVWLKTVFVYILFVMMTKSKWYFVVPVIILLLLDQTFKKEIAIRVANGKLDNEIKGRQEMFTHVVNMLVVLLIVVGMLHYMWIQYTEYHKDFSLYKFFFGIADRCKPHHEHMKMRMRLRKARG